MLSIPEFTSLNVYRSEKYFGLFEGIKEIAKIEALLFVLEWGQGSDQIGFYRKVIAR